MLISATCEDIEITQCAEFSSSSNGTFPNSFVESHSRGIEIYGILFQDLSCHPDATQLLCSMLYQDCDESNRRLPCRHFCEAVNGDCAEFGTYVDCSILPTFSEDPLCIQPDGMLIKESNKMIVFKCFGEVIYLSKASCHLNSGRCRHNLNYHLCSIN